MDDWVRASLGRGTWFEAPDRPARRLMAPSMEAPAEDDDLRVNVPLYLFDPQARQALWPLLSRFRRTGSLRCSCHEYRLMATGGVDAVLNAGAKPWDHAAGVLALTEAGGGAVCLDGQPYRPGRWAEPFLAVRRATDLAPLATRFARVLAIDPYPEIGTR